MSPALTRIGSTTSMGAKESLKRVSSLRQPNRKVSVTSGAGVNTNMNASNDEVNGLSTVTGGSLKGKSHSVPSISMKSHLNMDNQQISQDMDNTGDKGGIKSNNHITSAFTSLDENDEGNIVQLLDDSMEMKFDQLDSLFHTTGDDTSVVTSVNSSSPSIPGPFPIRDRTLSIGGSRVNNRNLGLGFLPSVSLQRSISKVVRDDPSLLIAGDIRDEYGSANKASNSLQQNGYLSNQERIGVATTTGEEVGETFGENVLFGVSQMLAVLKKHVEKTR